MQTQILFTKPKYINIGILYQTKLIQDKNKKGDQRSPFFY